MRRCLADGRKSASACRERGVALGRENSCLVLPLCSWHTAICKPQGQRTDGAAALEKDRLQISDGKFNGSCCGTPRTQKRALAHCTLRPQNRYAPLDRELLSSYATARRHLSRGGADSPKKLVYWPRDDDCRFKRSGCLGP